MSKAKKPSLKIPTPLPCPCCGSVKLDVGSQGAMLYGIRCIDTEAILQDKKKHGCGLSLVRSTPGRYPPGTKTLEEVGLWTLKRAVEAWNRRVKGK